MQIEAVRSNGRRSRNSVKKMGTGQPEPGLQHRSFHKPVIIERRRIDRDRVVLNTKTALDSLLHEWPLADCPYRTRALKACLAVMRGEQPPAVARRAFVAAAKAAKILREE